MRYRLLMLVHRIPYPPNKGDKIRSYHLLRHLAAHHEVHLGAFVDDVDDWAYRGALEKLCASVKLLGLNPLRRRLRSLSGLLTREALSIPYYRNRHLQRWVNHTIARQKITHVVVFSSTMAQYVQGTRHVHLRRVADLCDVDSDKWRQYSASHSGWRRWVYAREASRLLQAERAIAREFDATFFVTDAEAKLFRGLAPESVSRIRYFENGVDTDYFDPAKIFDSPYRAQEIAMAAEGDTQILTPDHAAADSAQSRHGPPVIVFTGAMDYWANVDAVEWFVAEIWPLILQRVPGARFFIVGGKPAPAVQALERAPGVRVTGRVPDVRPYLAHADVAVAPLRIARGTQNKVLEALAMARPVVCTSAAASGLNLDGDDGFCVQDVPAAFAEAVLALAGGKDNAGGRARVMESFGWDAHLRRVDRELESEDRT